MMKKNIVMMCMVLFIVLVGFGSFLTDREQAQGALFGSDNNDSEYIGFAEYAGIYMVKEMLPYAVYKECVLPHVQKLFSQEKISKKDFADFEQNVEKSLQAKGYSVRQLISDYAREESFSDSFHRNIDKFNEDAKKMGKGMKEGVESFMKGLTEDDKPKAKKPQSTEL